jgi:hypothetical protein
MNNPGLRKLEQYRVKGMRAGSMSVDGKAGFERGPFEGYVFHRGLGYVD